MIGSDETAMLKGVANGKHDKCQRYYAVWWNDIVHYNDMLTTKWPIFGA